MDMSCGDPAKDRLHELSAVTVSTAEQAQSQQFNM